MTANPLPRGLGCASSAGVVMLLAVLAGCGTSKEPVVFEPSEEQQVLFRISDTQDARLLPDRYRALFVEGRAPDDKLLQQHQQYTFSAKSAQVEGDTAVAAVVAHDPETGDEKGTLQWELERVDGTWFISDAPLP